MKKIIPFTSETPQTLLKTVKKVLLEKRHMQNGDLHHIVKKFLKRRKLYLELTKKHSTPCYVLDSEALEQSIENFSSSFQKYIPRIKIYYALKTNHYPYILQTVVKNGLGLDISSPREFDFAIENNCHDIIYTGPGKTINDLSYVLKKHPTTVIHIDSFGELKRLGTVTNKTRIKVKAGVRIYTSAQQKWTKFGIPLDDLKTFLTAAKDFPLIDLQGIQFHLSWNENALPYQKAIEELALYLKRKLSPIQLGNIKFIDFGGGFRPYKSEGTYPWLLPRGNIIKTANDYFGNITTFTDKYYISPAISIRAYARKIGEAIRTHLNPLVSCDYYTEPGRIICNNSMNILLKVIDKKEPNVVIMDGGINMIGWERFEYDYFPVINLSRPSLNEKKCTLYGSLCMPDDLWGYYFYGKTLQENDICLVPYQGAHTYSLAQNFIRPIPAVHIIK